MTRAEALRRREALRERLVRGAVRRRFERAVFAETGVRPDWWGLCGVVVDE